MTKDLALLIGPDQPWLSTTGFLDKIVPAGELMDVAKATAAQLKKINMTAHKNTKLKARKYALDAIRAGIDGLATEFTLG